ncbi:CPBP family intramembrane metalloprotease [bacterium]|nr:CPBP family intramembrane metalloprotease [bacterium]
MGVALLSFCLIPEGETVVHKLLILLAALFYFVLYGGALFIFLNHKAVLTVMGQTPTLPLNENSSSVFLKSKKSLKGYLGDVFLLCSLLLVEDILYIVFEQNYSGDLESIGNTIRLVHGFIRFAIVFCSVLFLFGARKGLFTLSNWKPKGAQVHFIFFKAVPILLLAMLGIKCISNIFSVRFFSNLEFMIYVVAMAIAAELFFRHYLFNGFLRFMSVRKTVFYTSLCYAVFMLLSGTCSKVYYIMLAIKIDSASVPDSVVVEQSMTPFIANFSHLFSFELLSVVSYFLFGLVLAWAYARTRLIIVPILLHVMAFGVMYALTLLESTC